MEYSFWYPAAGGSGRKSDMTLTQRDELICPGCGTVQSRAAFVCPRCRASLTEITVAYSDREELASDREVLEADGWRLAAVWEGSKKALAVKYRRWLWASG